jgi:hypothetical protein
VLVCYSVTRRVTSFDVLDERYGSKLRSHLPNSPYYVLVATHTDWRGPPNAAEQLPPEHSDPNDDVNDPIEPSTSSYVSTAEGLAAAQRLKFDAFFECSCTDPWSVLRVFRNASIGFEDSPAARSHRLAFRQQNAQTAAKSLSKENKATSNPCVLQ